MQEIKEVQRLRDWINNSFAFPYKLVLLVTFKCNLDCLYCNDAEDRKSSKYDDSDELTDAEWMDIVNQGIEMNVRDWFIPGLGEPFMRSKLIVNIFKKIKNKTSDSVFNLSTNGSLFTDKVIKESVKNGIDWIHISLDSPDRKTHDFLRGKKGTYNRILWALKRYMYWKQLFKTEKPRLSFDTVLTSKNYKQLIPLAELGSQYGIDYVCFNPLRIASGNINKVKQHNLRLNAKQKKEVYNYILSFNKKKYKIPLIFNGFSDLEMGMVSSSAEGFKKKKYISHNFKEAFLHSPCYEPWLAMIINFKGDVNYCTSCGFWDMAENIKDKSLINIWSGKPFYYVRSSILKHQPMKTCFGCGIIRIRKDIKSQVKNYFKNG